MSEKNTTQERFFEIVLILVCLGLGMLLYRMGSQRLVVLNLYYLPIVLAGFFLGRYRAGVLAVFSVISAAVVTGLDLQSLVGFGSPLVTALALTVWAATLGLTAILVGTLSDERTEKITELHDAYVGVVEVLSQYLSNADPRLNERSKISSRLAQTVARLMKLSQREIDDVRVATLLQDMESIEVTSKVIEKAIGNMSRSNSPEHTFHGSDLAQSLGTVLRGALPLLVDHSRPADSLPSEDRSARSVDSPMGAYVIRTVRNYVTLVFERPGRMTPMEAIDILKKDFDGDHHPAVLHALERAVLKSADEASRDAESELFAGSV